MKNKTEDFLLEEITQKIKLGDRTTLAKAITWAESTKEVHQKMTIALLDNLLENTGNSLRIAITGIPGAGKSTLIETLGLHLVNLGKKVAVLAIDPSSRVSGGSILGDKTRMEKLAVHPNAFIRPSVSGATLGGVAKNTFEVMLLCEAAGYDVILIETVGVGQSETLGKDITDFFLYLQIVGAGDELQGMKRGIMEMANLIFINKVNAENRLIAQNMQQEIQQALHYFISQTNEIVPVLLGSSLDEKDVFDIWEMIENSLKKRQENGFFEENRKIQLRHRFEKQVIDLLLEKYAKEHAIFLHEDFLRDVLLQKISTLSAAMKVVEGK